MRHLRDLFEARLQEELELLQVAREAVGGEFLDAERIHVGRDEVDETLSDAKRAQFCRM